MRLAVLTLVLVLLAAAPARAERVFGVGHVRVIEQGPRGARHVLVLVPGTSAGAAYFRPVARDLAARLPGWKVWSVDRRENRLEDHSVIDAVLVRRRPPADLFPYYLGWLTDSSIATHFAPADPPAAREWGMAVAVRDLRPVVRAARRGGRSVVLGGHSLGATIAIAYASWDFAGRAGARDLDGLVLIDGGSAGPPISAADARAGRAQIRGGSPFLDLTGLGLPWSAGVFNLVGSTLARLDPRGPSPLQAWPALPANLKPPVAATNAGGYGFALDSDTSPASLRLAQMHIGRLAPSGDWADGELGTVARAAEMFSGVHGIDGSAWYHPRRLSLDGQAVAGGRENPAQHVLGLRATHGRALRLPVYAIETSLGAGRVLRAARALARHPTLIDRHRTYAHVDPLVALPARNAFVKTVARFLRAR